MKRFIKVDSDVLIEAKYVAKLSDDGSDTTITVNWDTRHQMVLIRLQSQARPQRLPAKHLSTRLTTKGG